MTKTIVHKFIGTRLSKVACAAVVAAGMGLVAPRDASAIMTPTLAPSHGEMCIADILGNTYGGNYSLVGDDYVGTTGVTAMRVDDLNDQVWSGQFSQVRLLARFAPLVQEFGYLEGKTGGTFVSLLEADTYGMDIGSPISMDLDGHYRFARSSENGMYTSKVADNIDLMDHLVTYLIKGVDVGQNENQDVWVLSWEGAYNCGDEDYQDLVVEVVGTFVGGGVAGDGPHTNDVTTRAIPEPVTATMGFLGLTALAVRLTRRNRGA